MGKASGPPWWRWPVYAVANLAMLVACLWLASLVIGLYFRWNGLSALQIAGTVAAAMILPFALTTGLALRAIVAARNSKRDVAILFAALSFLPVPLCWLTMNYLLVWRT